MGKGWGAALAAALCGFSLLALTGRTSAAGSAAPAVASACVQRVLVAVDDSGSTFPNAATGFPGTDPSNLRGRAALAAAQLLVQRTGCAERVAAVAFGTDVQVLSAGFSARVPGAVAAAWLHPDNLNWTNTVGVLQAAHVLLAGSGHKALLILTDGYPQMPGVADAVMRADFASAARSLAAEGVAVDVILLQGAGSASGGAYAAWQPVWEQAAASTGGAFQVVRSAQQLPGAVDAAVGAIEEQAGGRVTVQHRLLTTPVTWRSGPAGVGTVLFAITADQAVTVTANCPGAAAVQASLPSGSGVVRVPHPRAGACTLRVRSARPGVPVTVGSLVPPVVHHASAGGPARAWWLAAAAVLLAAAGVALYRLAVGGAVLVPAQLTQNGQVLMNLEGLPRSGWKRLRSPHATLLGDRRGADFGVAHAPGGTWLAIRWRAPGSLEVRGPALRLPSGELARRWTAVPRVVELLLEGAAGGEEGRYTLECTEPERGLDG